jgi:hypothetical protein
VFLEAQRRIASIGARSRACPLRLPLSRGQRDLEDFERFVFLGLPHPGRLPDTVAVLVEAIYRAELNARPPL